MPGHLQIRSYYSPDYEECREIFSQGMQQLISITTCLIFSKLFWYITMVTIFAVMASFKWSILPLVACLFLSLILWALLYVVIYLQIWKIINYCLKQTCWTLKRPTCLTKAVTCGLLNGMVKL